MNKGFKSNSAALWICAIACCGWGYILDLKYYRITYYSWDLPLYANLMWNLCHGSLKTSLFGGNFLIDHFNAIAFVLVPFYYFFQSALTMLYFKLFAFFAGAYIFYLLAAKRVGGIWGIAFMLAYIFYPANIGMLFFEFNFENLALPLIFLLFYYFEEKKFLSFMACCFLLTMVKENMPLAVFMFGIYGFITRREDWLRWGLCPLLLGIGTFWGEVFIFTPWLRHGFWNVNNSHWSLYSRLGATPHDIARTFIFKEPEILKLLFNSRNMSFLGQLFGPLLVPAFLSPWVLLLGVPFLLQDLLSNFSGQQSIYYFYASIIVVFIFMAAVDFLGRINARLRIYLMIVLIFFVFLFDASYMSQWGRRVVPFQEKQAVAQYFLSQIPPDAKVVSSYKFLYLLSQRKDLYVLLPKRNVFTGQEDTIPDDVDYMVIDFASRVDGKVSVKQLLSQGQWKVQAAADEVVLLRKNAAHGETLIRLSSISFVSGQPLQTVMMVGDALKMEGWEIPSSLKFGQRIMPVVFYWKMLQDDKNTRLPKISLSIFQNAGRFYFKNRTPLYGLPLQNGEYCREIFYYFIPKLSPGNYKVGISPYPTSSTGAYIKNISVVLN